MDTFSSSPLMESFPSTRFSSPAPSPTRTENELPIDVDQSFNSSMSLSGGPPSLSPSLLFSTGYPVSPLVNTYDGFLSPTPAFGIKPRRPDPVPIQSKHSRLPSRDQVKPLEGLGVRQLGSGRVFGREISPNAMQRSTEPAKRKASKGMMLPPSIPDTKSFVPKHRGGIPMQWTSSNEEPGVAKLNFQPGMMRREVSQDSH